MNPNELPTQVKMATIQRERQEWLNNREVLTIRYRVNKRIDNPEGIKECQANLEKCELALDELDLIFKELQAASHE